MKTNIYLDTEFIEGKQKKRVFGTPYGETQETIDLISIGLCDDTGREYYAVNKNFNVEEAWYRYDEKVIMPSGDLINHFPEGYKEKIYWLRDNVLKSIFHRDFRVKACKEWERGLRIGVETDYHKRTTFNLKNFKYYLNRFGTEKVIIAADVFKWVKEAGPEPEFFGYYSDYDWVVFCWLFGYMKYLPKGWPMYCKDLKQSLVQRERELIEFYKRNTNESCEMEEGFLAEREDFMSYENYPISPENHHALEDVRWTRNLHNFIKKLDRIDKRNVNRQFDAFEGMSIDECPDVLIDMGEGNPIDKRYYIFGKEVKFTEEEINIVPWGDLKEPMSYVMKSNNKYSTIRLTAEIEGFAIKEVMEFEGTIDKRLLVDNLRFKIESSKKC